MRNKQREYRGISSKGFDSLRSQADYSVKMPRINKKGYLKTQPNDSLQIFQQQLDQMLRKKIKYQPIPIKKNKQLENQSSRQLKGLKKQLLNLKQIYHEHKQISKIDKKLQEILMEISIKAKENPKSQVSSQQFTQPHYLPPIQPYYSPYMQPYPPPNYSGNYNSAISHNTRYSNPREEQTRNRYKDKHHYRNKLRKIFYVVTFLSFLKSEAMKLSKTRKNNLRKYWLQKFDQQTNNIKNWLLEAHKYSFSIILQKKNISFDYQEQSKIKVKEQKQKLLLQIIQISLKQLLKQSTTQKISQFSESLESLCKNGSFIMSRFWTAKQLDIICISQHYGFIRIDQWGQKCLITLFIFIKMLVYNMLIQPHKFDSVNFPKGNQTLSQNMYILGSIYYHLTKQILTEFIQKRSTNNQYTYGNWLKLKKQFIVQCCQPLVYNKQYSADEFISGMMDYQAIQILKEFDQQGWNNCKDTMVLVINKLHEITLQRSKLTKKNLKYKMYN